MTSEIVLGIESSHIFALIIFASAFMFSVGIWFHRRINVVSKRSWRTERAIMVFVKLSIQETKRLHPKNASDFRELEQIVNTVLSENSLEAEEFKFFK